MAAEAAVLPAECLEADQQTETLYIQDSSTHGAEMLIFLRKETMPRERVEEEGKKTTIFFYR